MIRKIGLGIVALVGVVAIIGFFAREPISLFLFGRVMETRLMAPDAQFEDGIHVGICGAGSPMPDPDRSAPCTVVIAGDTTFVFDVGNVGNINAMGINPRTIDGVFLTHFHSDHIGDLGELMMNRWVLSNATSPLPVYGPTGVTSVVDGFNMAYGLDNQYRTVHHGEGIAPTSGKGGVAISFADPGEALVSVYKDKDLEVSAFSVDHSPISPAVGYRINYKDRSLVISGDTVVSENLIKYSEGVDLLLHEALSKELVKRMENAAENAGQQTIAKIARDIVDYHTDPAEVAEVAAKANVKQLVFHHIVPPLPLKGLEDTFMRGVKDAYDGPVHISRDGDFISMPVRHKRHTIFQTDVVVRIISYQLQFQLPKRQVGHALAVIVEHF